MNNGIYTSSHQMFDSQSNCTFSQFYYAFIAIPATKRFFHNTEVINRAFQQRTPLQPGFVMTEDCLPQVSYRPEKSTCRRGKARFCAKISTISRVFANFNPRRLHNYSAEATICGINVYSILAHEYSTKQH
ncbi:hypothetical protein [Dickeya dianthicola]|uniref:hypothetical protein n=1 Tax=Dickeya dianthicola TaxID=204039 RepID=UPI0011B274CE|nr:hypothetical protein [Dickeya dianthicola]MBI0456542.1 hypothetical protein [Dickeya dianthicola]MBI0465344.1 hypothetical protein [Dickeya dianthicola]MBI0485139.1 hypothetical protein [Dickeya dianthicola]MBI0501366.1 hypothetical protein [Dickeya dianthicola]MBT1427877.1 hypothetical protein [Dickeya dianthicola]